MFDGVGSLWCVVIFFSGIDEKLIEEVLGLDLFDHDGVTYKVADLGNACWVERLGPGATGWRFVAIQHFVKRYMPARYFACSPHLQRVKRLPISQYEIITVYICMPLGCICTEMFAVFCLKALWLVSRKAWSTSDLHVKCLEAFLRWHSDATVSVTRDDHQCRIRHFSSLALKAAVGISI